MVVGVDTGSVTRINAPFPGAVSARPGSGVPDTAPARNAAVPAAAPSVAGEARGAGPFAVFGLGGPLAPAGIVPIQQAGGEATGNGGAFARQGAVSASPPSAAASPPVRAEEEAGPDGLTEEEREQVRELQERDAEVRRHEQAHKAVGGQYAGAISYTYQTGPDGRRYAIGGQVPIDTSPIAGDPAATIRKLEQVRRAALAPAEPSGADRAVAAEATRTIQQARAEQARLNAEERAALLEGGREESGLSGIGAGDGSGEGAQAGSNAGEISAFAPAAFISGGEGGSADGGRGNGSGPFGARAEGGRSRLDIAI